MECGILLPVYPQWLTHLLLREQDSSWQGHVTPGLMYLPARTGGWLLSQLFHLDQQACSLTPHRCSAERKAHALSLSPPFSLSVSFCLCLSLCLSPPSFSCLSFCLFVPLCSLSLPLSVCISLSVFPSLSPSFHTERHLNVIRFLVLASCYHTA